MYVCVCVCVCVGHPRIQLKTAAGEIWATVLWGPLLLEIVFPNCISLFIVMLSYCRYSSIIEMKIEL